MWETSYAREPINYKLFFLKLLKKLWLLPITIVIFSILVGGIYCFVNFGVKDGYKYRARTIYHVTFDSDALRSKIQEVCREKSCKWPIYDRLLHNPVEDAITVDGDIVLLEGNYLLADIDGFRNLSEFADYTISISAKEELLRKRLIDRKEASGNTRQKAEEFVDFSDMANVRLCLTKIRKADLELVVSSDTGELVLR